LVTIGAVVNLIYLGILFYFFFFMSEMGEQELVKGSAILYAIVWGLGIIWYFYWKRRNKNVGVDTNVTFGELPPD
jgi:membrane protein DedA with SNARE-associated domain